MLILSVVVAFIFYYCHSFSYTFAKLTLDSFLRFSRFCFVVYLLSRGNLFFPSILSRAQRHINRHISTCSFCCCFVLFLLDRRYFADNISFENRQRNKCYAHCVQRIKNQKKRTSNICKVRREDILKTSEAAS